ncbi:MAG: NUDIX domain-containing protein [Candidatus Aenigmarchaeota archaeon]|nr:NUDIX domain-containing protein [Candidatus Aenigmarchaeota archaeon]
MKHKNVVICIVKHGDKILLLKRRPKDKIYPGRWNFVCGSIEENEKPLETAYREIKEESGISQKNVNLVRPTTSLLSFESLRLVACSLHSVPLGGSLEVNSKNISF